MPIVLFFNILSSYTSFKIFFTTFRTGQRQISVKSRRFDVIHDIHIPASLLSICITVLCILYVAIFIIFNVFHDTFFTFTPPEVTSLASKQPLCGLRSLFFICMAYKLLKSVVVAREIHIRCVLASL